MNYIVNITNEIQRLIQDQINLLFGNQNKYRFMKANNLIDTSYYSHSHVWYVNPYNTEVEKYVIEQLERVIQQDGVNINFHGSGSTLCVNGVSTVDFDKLIAEMNQKVQEHFKNVV